MKSALLFTVLLSFAIGTASAGNILDIKVRQGENPDVDTIWAGLPASFDLYFENDEELDAMTLTLEVYSDDGAGWTWEEGIYEVNPPADTVWEDITIVEGSRMYPPESVWDMHSFGMSGNWDEAFDGISPDEFAIGGVSDNPPNMTTGSLEHNATIRFRANGPVGDEVMTLCIDTTHLHGLDNLFNGVITGNYTPECWDVGTRCWPVKQPPILCGDANFDGAINAGDVVFLINYIFKSGSAPLMECSADANGDGVINVGDPVWLIGYVFRGGPPPRNCCD